MGDKTQPQSAVQRGRTLDWRRKRVRVTKTVEVEWDDFLDLRLEDMVEDARKELGIDIIGLDREDPMQPGESSQANLHPVKPNSEISKQATNTTSRILIFGKIALAAVALGVSVDFLVSQGLNKIAMGDFLGSLAPYIRALLDSGVPSSLIGLYYKKWKRDRQPH